MTPDEFIKKQKRVSRKKETLHKNLNKIRTQAFIKWVGTDDNWRTPYITRPRFIIEESNNLKGFFVSYIDRVTGKGVVLPFSLNSCDSHSKVFNLIRNLVRTYMNQYKDSE